MTADMEAKMTIVFLGLLFVLVESTKVDVKQEWKPNFGWELTCSWNLLMNDSLQSVKLIKNNQQFLIFRPESQPSSLSKKQSWNLIEHVMKVECSESADNGIKGRCVLTIEPLMPPTRDFTFGCEVSGERPYFRIAEKEVLVQALVRPSAAVLSVTSSSEPAGSGGRVTLNCSASALPAPRLVWSVDGQEVPHDFHGTPTWNYTSKLWGAWSSFTPQPQDLDNVKCTPVVAAGRELYQGPAAMYNTCNRITGYYGATVLTILSMLLLR